MLFQLPASWSHASSPDWEPLKGTGSSLFTFRFPGAQSAEGPSFSMFSKWRVNELESWPLPLVIQSLSSWGRGQIREQGLLQEGESPQGRVDDLEGPCRRLSWPGESPYLVPSHLNLQGRTGIQHTLFLPTPGSTVFSTPFSSCPTSPSSPLTVPSDSGSWASHPSSSPVPKVPSGIPLLPAILHTRPSLPVHKALSHPFLGRITQQQGARCNILQASI